MIKLWLLEEVFRPMQTVDGLIQIEKLFDKEKDLFRLLQITDEEYRCILEQCKKELNKALKKQSYNTDSLIRRKNDDLRLFSIQEVITAEKRIGVLKNMLKCLESKDCFLQFVKSEIRANRVEIKKQLNI